ncbi:MAG: protein kinase, partial [Planctomycetota bacterium]|nr:protein kinase [Planctomycetota bacterium]
MATDPLIGQTVGGCEILEVLGQGGMGVIYKARQKSLDRVVALKVLAPHLANDINFVSRFQKEARAIAKVNHPNILAVYDVGDDQHTNYMIMELIDGRSLAELQAERRGAIPWEEAMDYIRQASQGLEAAQAVGIIHRDIKPENLMLTKKGVIKVSDFGLAKEADAGSGATSVDAVMGTPAFMSPEQCDGKKVDGRSDTYSLGGTFYRLVTGRLPFEAETAMSMMYRHKHEALIPPHEIVATIPEAISDVIVKMMAKKREQRYQTMTEVIDALEGARRPAASPFAAAGFGTASPAPAPASVFPGAPVALPAGVAPAAAPFPAGVDEDREPPSGMFGAGSAGGFSRPAVGGDHMPAQPSTVSGRMPAQPGPPGGFGGVPDSSSRLSMPSSVMGLGGAGLAAPDEGFTNVARGDELIGRGDRIGGLRYYRQALQSPSLDQVTRSRIEQEIRKEIATRRQAIENLFKRGMLVEASRESRVLVELDPADELSRNMLKDLDNKLSMKRTLINDVRTAIASGAFEKAIKIWDSTPTDLRDEALGKQIEQLRAVVVPALKLAQQGDEFSRQGRLEEAMSSYEDALKINPGCELARQGQKDTEQKLQRIDYMLKEGFQCSLEQEYAKAVELWKPILALRPGHLQAVKSIVDACMALAQQRRAHGDLEGALAAYREASQTDPQNRGVRRALEELTNLCDKEQALIDRAQEAAARGRWGAAIGYWKEVQRINPSSKRAAQQIAELGKQRSGGLAKAFIVLLVLAAGGAGGYQYYTETAVLTQARRKMKDGNYGAVAQLLSAARIILFKAEKQELIDAAELEMRLAAASTQKAAGDFVTAAATLDDLARQLAATDRQRSFELAMEALECKAQHALKQGKAALKDRKWTDAARQFGEVRALMQDQPLNNQQLAGLRNTANTAEAFALKILSAERIQDDKARRLAELHGALRLAEELGFPECVDLVKKEMVSINYDPEAFKKLLDDAKRELTKTPADTTAARKLLLAAKEANPNDAAARKYLDYCDSLDSCARDGMSLYAKDNPASASGAWGGDERRKAFCIDRYEFPNKAGALPQGNVTWLEAQDLCRKAGKELCLASQWQDACQGYEGRQYPYGAAADSSACNTDGTAVLPSGSKPECKNSLGVFDMSGNLAEWVDSGADAVAEIMGGAFKTAAKNASCIETPQQDKKIRAAQVGFRCCRRLDDA